MTREWLRPEEVRPKMEVKEQSVLLDSARAIIDAFRHTDHIEGKSKRESLVKKIKGLKGQNPKPEDLKRVAGEAILNYLQQDVTRGTVMRVIGGISQDEDPVVGDATELAKSDAKMVRKMNRAFEKI
jgi:hypothetical protein